MKNSDLFMKSLFPAFVMIFLVKLFFSCEMPATSFDKVESASYVEKQNKANPVTPDSSVKVMTWNIRFGIGRGPWFGDACGYKVVYSSGEVLSNLGLIADRINQEQPDILLLQEADVNSTRSAYIDQVKWVLEHSYFNYAVYGMQWKAQFIPSDGLGRLEESNAIFSRWPLTEAKRIQLALRKDQSSIERYFYERCCIVEAKVSIPGFEDFYVLNTHASAFATDESKHDHLIEFKSELDRLSQNGTLVVGGGDLNSIPPGSDSTDYCIEDMCPDESFHHPGDNLFHKDGKNYEREKEWLVPLFTGYNCVFNLNDYLQNQAAYFTRTPRPDHFWDRTLDYLFTNSRWRKGATLIHQDFTKESDHVAVSGVLLLRKK